MSSHESSNSLLTTHYEGRPVRMIFDAEGMPRWVAQDAGDVLGIAEVRSTLRSFPDDEKGVHTIHTLGGPQEMLTVNEAGLYRLIFQSRKPEAEAFKRWVFHDVLPSIRHRGTYSLPTAPKPIASDTPKKRLEVSLHMVKVWQVLRAEHVWFTNKELASRTGVSRRAVSDYTHEWLAICVLERHEVFPRHFFRLAVEAQRQHARIWQHMDTCLVLFQSKGLC